MPSLKKIYKCTDCGDQTAKWFGRCPSCGSWNTLVEEDYAPIVEKGKPVKKTSTQKYKAETESIPAKKLNEIDITSEIRFSTGLSEFDRVLGGGIVRGSVVLISGEPGIGKSTLLLQICDKFGEDFRILYVSGEESQNQIKMRAKRLGVSSENLFVCTETSVEKIHATIDDTNPNLIIIDSIQTMYDENVTSTAGSVTQVRETAMSFMTRAKSEEIAVIMVGHINKEGGIAGPKVLEHMVDAVLYFEGERQQSYRIVRAIKNRYGSTNEIGVFTMKESGLTEVTNPSEMLLSGRLVDVPGNCAVSIMEGSRPLIAEIQALVTETSFPSPRRMATGIDYNRLCMLLAVLEKRLRLKLALYDAYVNVVGGLKIDEPSCDLAVALSVMSSYKDLAVDSEIVAIGEIGLSGEIRQVNNIEQRVNEAARLGFKKIVIPHKNNITVKNAQIIYVKSIFDAMDLL